jgi:hypothetical protein
MRLNMSEANAKVAQWVGKGSLGEWSCFAGGKSVG